MKLSRRDLRRLIESVINEAETKVVNKDSIGYLTRYILQGYIEKAESLIQSFGTDEVTLNKIDSVFRSSYHKMAKDHMGGGMSPAFTDRAEQGISFPISKLARYHMPDAYKGVDADDIGHAYIKATQTALKDYPGLLALFNANK